MPSLVWCDIMTVRANSLFQEFRMHELVGRAEDWCAGAGTTRGQTSHAFIRLEGGARPLPFFSRKKDANEEIPAGIILWKK